VAHSKHYGVQPAHESEQRGRPNLYPHGAEPDRTLLDGTTAGRVIGAVVGQVTRVRQHPHGDHIWLADVDLGDHGIPVQIVFGGTYKVKCGDLVPVAPPGARVIIHSPELAEPRHKKVRRRRIRGELSYGMMCSLNELGWTAGGPDEVAVLRRLTPGDQLDDLLAHERSAVVVGWEHAHPMNLASVVDGTFELAPRGARPAASA
jgi:tRNA-binding EMAP/Myf-like protein